jgi:hypothetical protein
MWFGLRFTEDNGRSFWKVLGSKKAFTKKHPYVVWVGNRAYEVR